MTTTKHPVARKGYAIVRVELCAAESEPWTNRIKVKAIVWSEEAAEKEVARLNSLNREKGCLYFWQGTRVAGEAGSISPQ
jgi:hypothetical protein